MSNLGNVTYLFLNTIAGVLEKACHTLTSHPLLPEVAEHFHLAVTFNFDEKCILDFYLGSQTPPIKMSRSSKKIYK